MKLKSLSDLETLRKKILVERESEKPCIAICTCTSCRALGAEKIITCFKEEIKKRGLKDRIEVKEVGCPGFCVKGPTVTVYPQELYFFQVQPSDVSEIVLSPVTKAKYLSEIPFYKHQKRILLENNAKIDPTELTDYIAVGGYTALTKVLFEMTPEQVLEEIKKAGLRGRGGGGFPAGRKWETTRNASGEPKYVIANCEEGNPGAFMDRSLMENNPHSVLEGLIVGAYAIGSHEGFIFIRQAARAIENTRIAVAQAEKYGLVGEDILGSGFDFTVKIHRGAELFVTGESTALMTAIEGRVGEPKPKYVHTAEKGLWNKPSNLNNVETWANVPFIINKGADWFRSIGTEDSKGTKLFSLVGNVKNAGLIEVPMGITIRDVIYKIGGGVRNGKKFKAVQIGGPLGGFIPETLLDTPIDFDELTRIGAALSGGIIVMDEDTCMVDVTTHVIKFLSEESCGKCVPCREGLRQMLNILNNICLGKGKDGDIELLEELSDFMDNSLCALGRTAPNPVLTSIKYFRDTYDTHIQKKYCPTGVCQNLKKTNAMNHVPLIID